jgi:hypothetical protein
MIWTLKLLVVTMLAVAAGPWAWSQAVDGSFLATELLGRPTANGVTIHIAPNHGIEVYFEYGTEPGVYSNSTPLVSAQAGVPLETRIDSLAADTRYYYRMWYRLGNEGEFVAREERSFHTQRPPGSSFTFAIQADPHLDENSDPDIYRLTLANELASAPDFLIDLGDTFMSDKLGAGVTYDQVLQRHLLLRSYYDLACHSMPLFLLLGNHEGEWGSRLDGTGNNLPVWATKIRKQYYPNPMPDEFYGGNPREDAFVGMRQNYYSWEWGDALFVVLDPYWNVPQSPEQRGDWSLTLGREQYDWLKQVLEKSKAAYKFVFAHNLVGGSDRGGKMRGGVEAAKYLEWGGYNLDDTWGFDLARPGWDLPIHQLLLRNNVTAFFHGHDHVYARQDLDGITYQEVPQPSARNYRLGNRAETYGYVEGDILGGSGYLRVTVTPDEVNVEYVLTWTPTNESEEHRNGEVAHSYTMKPRNSEPVPSSLSRKGRED